MTKQKIGEVYIADSVIQECPCGEEVYIKKYIQSPEILKGDKTITTALGMCKCGNIFIGWKPQKTS